MITAARARAMLAYDKATGLVRWAVDGRGKITKGARAGGAAGNGYRRIRVDGEIYLEHRLIWLIVKGRWPRCQIDHKNGARADNRWANLREATAPQNIANAGVRAHNTTGFKWVRRHARGKFQATIQVTLGTYKTALGAHRVARRAAALLHKDFFNDGAGRGANV